MLAKEESLAEQVVTVDPAKLTATCSSGTF
jgi:hypothetical protein